MEFFIVCVSSRGGRGRVPASAGPASVVAQLAGLLPVYDEMIRRGGAVGVVALAAIPQHVRRMLVEFHKFGLVVTGEAIALEAKPAPPALSQSSP